LNAATAAAFNALPSKRLAALHKNLRKPSYDALNAATAAAFNAYRLDVILMNIRIHFDV